MTWYGQDHGPLGNPYDTPPETDPAALGHLIAGGINLVGGTARLLGRPIPGLERDFEGLSRRAYEENCYLQPGAIRQSQSCTWDSLARERPSRRSDVNPKESLAGMLRAGAAFKATGKQDAAELSASFDEMQQFCDEQMDQQTEEGDPTLADPSSVTFRRVVLSANCASVMMAVCHIAFAVERKILLEKLSADVAGLREDLVKLSAGSKIDEAQRTVSRVISSISDSDKAAQHEGELNLCCVNLSNLARQMGSLLEKVSQAKATAEAQQQNARDRARTGGFMAVVGTAVALSNPVTGAAVIGGAVYMNFTVAKIEIENLARVKEILLVCDALEDELLDLDARTREILNKAETARIGLAQSRAQASGQPSRRRLPPRLAKLAQAS